MARWQRDPRARKKLAVFLAVLNDATLLVVAGFLGFLVLDAFWARMFSGERTAVPIIHIILMVIFAAWLVLQTIMYVRGKEWARKLYIALNVAFVVVGVAWFLFSWVQYHCPRPHAVIFGLLMPFCLLFPLLWPQLTFSPRMPRQSPQPPTQQEAR